MLGTKKVADSDSDKDDQVRSILQSLSWEC